MFDIGVPELMVLAIVAVFVFGPDKLPEMAHQAAKLVKGARRFVASARAQVADELGPEYANMDLNDLNPRKLVQKHLLDDLDDDETPARPGHRPLEQGEAAPFDTDAT
ncbi:MAG: sec-independent translocase [Nocardioidaceae bacterium]